MPLTKNKNSQHSSYLEWLIYSLSFYSFLKLYITESILWIVVAFNLITSFFILSYGILRFSKIVSINILPARFKRATFLFLGLIYFSSAVYGFISLINLIQLIDKSVILLPSIAFILIIGGNIIEIFMTQE